MLTTNKNVIRQINSSLLLPALSLFFLGLATRLPCQGQIAWGDGGNFALAVEHFDVRLEQPQMPGMFIIFIYFARFFNLFLHNPTQSLVLVNVVASAVGAAMLYILGTQWFNVRVGWTTALLMLASPLIWFNGEMALSHVLEFTWVVLIDYAAYYTGLGNKKALFALGLLMGLAGGIRPSTPFFLLPLSLVATWLGWRKRGYKLVDIAIAVVIGIIALVLWMTPLIISSGGWDSYWQLVQQWLPVHTEREDADSLIKIVDNIFLLLKAILRGVGIAIIPMLWALFANRSAINRSLRKNWAVQALALSIAPGILYFLFVHLRRKAHTLTIMPGLILLGALAIVWLSKHLYRQNTVNKYPWQKSRRHFWIWLTAIIVSLNGLFFLLGPLGVPTWREIRSYDAKFLEPMAVIRERFAPETTAILSHPLHKRIVAVYLPEYQQPHLSSQVAAAPDQPHVLPLPINTLVLLDRKVLRNPGQDDGFQKIVMSSGKILRYRSWSSPQQLQVTATSSQLISN